MTKAELLEWLRKRHDEKLDQARGFWDTAYDLRNQPDELRSRALMVSCCEAEADEVREIASFIEKNLGEA